MSEEAARRRWQAYLAPVLEGKAKLPGGVCVDCGGDTPRNEVGGLQPIRCHRCKVRFDRERNASEESKARRRQRWAEKRGKVDA